jgi:glyoxylase-like metal-dependent hydrolase (beta-lactamase superfamily II)
MLRLHVFNTGWAYTSDKSLYLGGDNTTRTLPVQCFVLEHPRGLLVFDTGLYAISVAPPGQHAGWVNERAIRFRSLPGMNLATQMRTRGLFPEDVAYVVLSHLHRDHTGDLQAFPQAQVLLTRQEWQAAQSPLRRWRGYRGREYAGSKLVLLDLPLFDHPPPNVLPKGSYGLDLMGDGTLLAVPTFGHTAGHQSLLAFLPQGVVLLAGDAVYVREGYIKPAAQPRAHCPDMAWRSLMGIHALAKGEPTAIILPTHDDSMLHGLQRPDIVTDSTYPTPSP